MKEKRWQEYLSLLVDWHNDPCEEAWVVCEAAFWEWAYTREG